MGTHMYQHTHTPTYTQAHTHIHTCAHTYTQALTHTNTHVHIQGTHTHAHKCMQTHIHACTHTHTHTHTRFQSMIPDMKALCSAEDRPVPGLQAQGSQACLWSSGFMWMLAPRPEASHPWLALEPECCGSFSQGHAEHASRAASWTRMEADPRVGSEGLGQLFLSPPGPVALLSSPPPPQRHP